MGNCFFWYVIYKKDIKVFCAGKGEDKKVELFCVLP